MTTNETDELYHLRAGNDRLRAERDELREHLRVLGNQRGNEYEKRVTAESEVRRLTDGIEGLIYAMKGCRNVHGAMVTADLRALIAKNLDAQPES